MELTNSLKKEFVKNYDLPIQLVQEPYFSYTLKQLDPYFNTIAKYEKWKKFIFQFENQEAVFSCLNTIVNSVISFVKGLEGYKQFSQMKMDSFQITNNNLASQNLYIPENAGKSYYSIDLKQANFQALKIVVPELQVYPDFKSLLLNFTKEEVLLESKKVRQVILGNLNPARQQTIQKYIIHSIYADLIKQGVNSNAIKSSSSDELIVDGDVKFELNQSGVSVEKFVLEQIHPNFSYFVKKTDKIKFKNIPSMNLLEVIKYYNKQKVCDFDLCFYYEKRVAKFQESLFHATNRVEVSED
jgi:hypothetical protein